MFDDQPFPLSIYIGMYMLLGFCFGFLVRILSKYLFNKTIRGKGENINSKGRWLRACLGLGLLVATYFFGWNPYLLFFAGFCFFEAIFSWCGFYAAIGKDSCPLNQ